MSPECPRKRGVSEGASDGVSRGPWALACGVCKKCPESVPGVFWTEHSGDTLGTLFAHSTGQRPKARRHPIPVFRDTLGDALGTLRARSKGPKDSCPKNLLRLFLRNNLKRLKITSKIKNTLKNCHFLHILQRNFGGGFKKTSGNKNNFLRLKITSKDSYQKNPRVRKIRVRNSGAGNGSANFMDTWKKSVLSAGKPVSVKFLLFRGGFGGGGGSADFIFMGARIFLILGCSQAAEFATQNPFNSPLPLTV